MKVKRLLPSSTQRKGKELNEKQRSLGQVLYQRRIPWKNSRIRGQLSHHKEVKMKTRTRLPAANGIAPELLLSSFLLYSFAHFLFFLERKRRWLEKESWLDRKTLFWAVYS